MSAASDDTSVTSARAIGARVAADGHPWPLASTGLVALLGWPVAHSASPAMHNAAFAALGLDLVYLALPTPPEDLATVVRALGAAGAVGANVTVPHKEAVRASCNVLTDEAALIGAVNTLVWTGQGLVGDDTDALGLAQALTEEAIATAGSRALVLGTGGAARAAVVALARGGAAVTVAGRDEERRSDLGRLASRFGAGHRAIGLDDAAFDAAVRDADVVVNATTLGMRGERLPEAMMTLAPAQVALDLVYGVPTTPFVLAAREGGVAAHDGRGMLLGQAAIAFERWTGREAPVAVMADALHRSIASRDADATAHD